MGDKAERLTSIFESLQAIADKRQVSLKAVCIEFDFLIEREQLALDKIEGIEGADWKEVCFPMMHSFVDDLAYLPQNEYLYIPMECSVDEAEKESVTAT